MRNADTFRRLIKPLLGFGLLLLVLSQLQAEKLQSALAATNWLWFVLAVALALSANLLCAIRWRKIVQAYGLGITPRVAARLYFQGVTANTVLPGGIIGGDIWRTVGLVKHGMAKARAAQTVLIDRISGFWSLSVLATLALAAGWGGAHMALVPLPLLAIYGLAMLGIAVGPILLMPFRATDSRLIFKTAGVSIASQVLTILAFFSSLIAVGAQVDPLLLAALCAGIFLAAVVPASIGGFGSREVASIFFLAILSVEREPAFLGSVLFGLTATLQGLISFVLRVRPQTKP